MSPRHPDSGFTTIELLVAVAIIAAAAGTAVAVTSSVLPSVRADSQARRVISLLQYGRDLAIAHRRNVEVVFDVDTQTTSLVLLDGVARTVQAVTFEDGVRFHQLAYLGDTPERYGAETAIDFGGASRVMFEPDGSVIDETGLPANGTIFLGLDGTLIAARAITVTGTTARVRMYRWSRADTPKGGWWAPQ